MFDKSTSNDKSKATTKTSAKARTKPDMGQSTTIGTSIKIKGELSGEEDLVIQGNVEGTILLQENSVSVGEHGKIQADVYAKNITIQGELSGDLHGAEKVTVTRSGKVRGNIIAPRVVLEDGASFKGSIDMDSKPAVPARIPDTANTPAKAKNA